MSTRSARRLGAVLVLVLLLTALVVPAASAAPSGGSNASGCTPRYYRVVPGDNLTKIAYRFGTTVWQLQQWNHIPNPDRIYIGQTLIVGYRCAPPPPPPCQWGCKPPPPPPPPPPGAPWQVQLWANRDLSGPPAITYAVNGINFNWGWGSPAPGIPADGFSARYTNVSNLSGGTYRLWLRTDDGARVWVDSNIVLDAWRIQPVTGYFVDVPIGPGFHSFTVEYFENDGLAELSFSVQRR